MVSGGFDPLTIGHIRLFKKAYSLGYLTVILNSDDFLMRKKSYVFMPYKERKEIIESIKYVSKVIKCIDKDDTICKTLEYLKPDIFCNGGDRNKKNIPEIDVCNRLNIKTLFGVGGEKIQSSSWLVKRAFKLYKKKRRKCGIKC